MRVPWRIASIAVLVLVLTGAHFAVPHHAHEWHEFLFKATYVPIILAGLFFGARGGLVTSGIVSALCLIHVQYQLGGHLLTMNIGRTLDIALYNLIAAVTGLLSSAQTRARRRSDRLAEEQAALRGQLEKSYEALRRQTQELFRAEEQLRRAERLAALGELTASIAHEIRTPVSGITGASEILGRKDISPEVRAEFTAILNQEAKRLDRVVHGILNFVRGHRSEVSDVNLRETVQRLLDLLRKEARHADVSLINAVPAALRLRTDPLLLEQIAFNLVLNAVQAMPGGGEVRVEAAAEEGRVRLTVRDNGPGIPPNLRERIFDPFFTTRAEGTGLGLSIARRIARGMGGDLVLASGQDEGTAFAVILPATPKVLDLAQALSGGEEEAPPAGEAE